jgi:hypothetical protein
MSTEVPVILVGKDFWEPLLGWIKKEQRDRLKTIGKEDFNLLQLCDTPEEAMKIIKKTPERLL